MKTIISLLLLYSFCIAGPQGFKNYSWMQNINTFKNWPGIHTDEYFASIYDREYIEMAYLIFDWPYFTKQYGGRNIDIETYMIPSSIQHYYSETDLATLVFLRNNGTDNQTLLVMTYAQIEDRDFKEAKASFEKLYKYQSIKSFKNIFLGQASLRSNANIYLYINENTRCYLIQCNRLNDKLQILHTDTYIYYICNNAFNLIKNEIYDKKAKYDRTIKEQLDMKAKSQTDLIN